MQKKSYTVYWAGALFNLKDLIGNQVLAKAVEGVSKGRYAVRLPQDIPFGDSVSAVDIRNADFAELIQSDVVVANFDGAELDSGTVVEFCVAKSLDMPVVLLRSDYRNGGDSQEVPWNLMCAGWPRTKTLCLDTMHAYQISVSGKRDRPAALNNLAHDIACVVVEKLDEARKESSWLTAGEALEHFRRTVRSIGGDLDMILTDEKLAELIECKRRKKLL